MRVIQPYLEHARNLRFWPMDIETDDGSPGPVHIEVVDRSDFLALLEIAEALAKKAEAASGPAS
jgi:hypothetical protein